MNSSHLHQQLQAGQLEEALQSLATLAEQAEAQALRDQVTQQYSRYSALKAEEQAGTISQEQEQIQEAQVNASVIAMIHEWKAQLDSLPPLAQTLAQEPASASKPTGISETRLKNQVMLLLLLLKLAVVVFLYIQWESGGFSKDQFTGTLSILVPIFTAYLTLMIRDFSQRETAAKSVEAPRRSRRYQFMMLILMLGYAWGMVLLIGLKARGSLDYQSMTLLLTLLESGMGAYVGILIFSLFKPDAST